jgi:hypothetical protein
VCSSPDGTCGTLISGPGPCAPCPNGVACGNAADCGTGVGCSSRAGQTICGGPGATCANNNSRCYFGNCNGGICGGGAALFGAPCGTPNGSTNAPGHNEVCQTGWYCKPLFGNVFHRCRSQTA